MTQSGDGQPSETPQQGEAFSNAGASCAAAGVRAGTAPGGRPAIAAEAVRVTTSAEAGAVQFLMVLDTVWLSVGQPLIVVFGMAIFV